MEGAVAAGILVLVATAIAFFTFPPARQLILYMVAGLRSLLKIFFLLPFRIRLAAVWLPGVIFLYINAPALYDDGAKWQAMLLLYLVSLAFVFGLTRRPNPLMQTSTIEFIIYFGMSFALAATLILFFQPASPEPAVLSSENVYVLLTHAFVVAVGEELLYRFAFPSLFVGLHAFAAQFITGIAFGFTHYYVYDAQLDTLIFASIMGIIFGAITAKFQRRGLFVAMGLHAAWNAWSLGFI